MTEQPARKPTTDGGVNLSTAPIVVKTAEDLERVRALLRQAVQRSGEIAWQNGHQCGFREGVLLGIEEGIRIGRASALTESPAAVVEALLASPRAQPQPAAVKSVLKSIERDAQGRISRVLETPA